jgi:hypothetical protein
MSESMADLVSGATVLACLVIGLFFLRFWQETRDRLFAFFAPAFWLLAVNAYLLGITSRDSEIRHYLYLSRLAGFVLIIIAIVEKNLQGKSDGD